MKLEELQEIIKNNLHIGNFIIETPEVVETNKNLGRGQDGIIVYQDNDDNWHTFYRERGIISKDSERKFTSRVEVCDYLLKEAEDESKNCSHLCEDSKGKWFICYHNEGLIKTREETFDSQEEAYQFLMK